MNPEDVLNHRYGDKCIVCGILECHHWEGHCPTVKAKEPESSAQRIQYGIPGVCFDIDGCCIHPDGTWCEVCRFGLGESRFGEPTVKPRSVSETIAMRKVGATWKKKA